MIMYEDRVNELSRLIVEGELSFTIPSFSTAPVARFLIFNP